MDMHLTKTADAATPWARGVNRLAHVVQQRLMELPLEAQRRTLWLGGGYSQLLALCGPQATRQALVADADPRQLRRGVAAAGEGARPLRLLDLADLRRDGAGVEAVLRGAQLRDLEVYLALEERLQERFQSSPAVADQSMDHVVLDFALNRVDAAAQPRLLAEAMRVLRRGGRLLCAALVADEPAWPRRATPGSTGARR